jgi:hypothetical protein
MKNADPAMKVEVGFIGYSAGYYLKSREQQPAEGV